ncbi:MAG TPA: nicotinamide riboside transporter PnuC [Gaiellaceae bacterium]|nr:nicotinamide riboside transporter PnuC [Gaiellaceae bacterium]
MSYLAHLSRSRDWIVGTLASAFLIAGSATGSLPFSTTETLGFVTGAASVWLLVRQSIWNFPAGIVNGVFYLVLFANARFFADSALQIVFIGLGIFGWWWWLRGRRGRAPRPIVRIGVGEAALLGALTVAASWGLLVYLRSIDDAAPVADAVTTALSLAASWMQARKQIENWAIWIAADAIYIPLYFVKSLPLTGVLYVIFAAMCVKGWRDWRRALSVQKQQHWNRGVVIGKFHPFHSGHRHLIDTAVGRAGEVTVIVVCRTSESIPGELRKRWIEEAFPGVRVVLLDQDAVGLSSEDSPGWAAETIRVLGGRPDVCFTSESYGDPWAKAMGCDHVLVDRRRRTFPISGTRIRRDPLANMAFLRGGARGHYVKRVCLLGAESSGKTTLARALAERYGTVWNPEVGHMYSWYRAGDPTDWGTWRTEEFVEIANLQNWYEDFLAQFADRVIFCDTNAWTTGLFHETYLGERSSEVDAAAEGREYDLYILCDPDTPFRQDEVGIRVDGPHRREMYERYLRHVQETGVPYIVVRGAHAGRMAAATEAVDAALRSRELAVA